LQSHACLIIAAWAADCHYHMAAANGATHANMFISSTG
jgi:hypothetical protein